MPLIAARFSAATDSVGSALEQGPVKTLARGQHLRFDAAVRQVLINTPVVRVAPSGVARQVPAMVHQELAAPGEPASPPGARVPGVRIAQAPVEPVGPVEPVEPVELVERLSLSMAVALQATRKMMKAAPQSWPQRQLWGASGINTCGINTCGINTCGFRTCESHRSRSHESR